MHHGAHCDDLVGQISSNKCNLVGAVIFLHHDSSELAWRSAAMSLSLSSGKHRSHTKCQTSEDGVRSQMEALAVASGHPHLVLAAPFGSQWMEREASLIIKFPDDGDASVGPSSMAGDAKESEGRGPGCAAPPAAGPGPWALNIAKSLAMLADIAAPA